MGGIFKQYVHNRVHDKNNSFNFAITGPTGSGKSYSALYLALKWDPNFSADNIVFTGKELVELINSDKLQKGAFIMFEEAGVSLNNREWASKGNNMIQKLLQVIRSRNYIICFTVPDFAFVDSATRKLFHAHFMTKGIDHKNNLCKIKPYLLQIDQRTGKVYYKFLKFKINGQTKKIGILSTGKPPAKLVNAYEKKKHEFVTNLNNTIREKINAPNKAETKKLIEGEHIERARKIKELRDKKVTWPKVGQALNMKGETVRLWYFYNKSLLEHG